MPATEICVCLQLEAPSFHPEHIEKGVLWEDILDSRCSDRLLHKLLLREGATFTRPPSSWLNAALALGYHYTRRRSAQRSIPRGVGGMSDQRPKLLVDVMKQPVECHCMHAYRA